ncbi:MAG: peptidylprolyl isomerase, partial [Bdellovibrionales bacterium]|nr:peptidylprolyl isomerase [Bdellovibrionales bacterium]
TAVIYTELGEIHFELFPEVAPWHVANFKYRADKGLYKNSKFHIFEPNYLVQGGAENGDEKHQPVYWLPPEFSEMKHEPGILGMARQPDSINPQRRSHGSQFHLILGYPAHMDSHYTIFGKLTKGMDVLQRLRRNDIIYDIKVFVRPLKKSPAKGLPRRDNPQ